MKNIEQIIKKYTILAIKECYETEINEKIINISQTRKDLEGDLTLVVFPFLRFSKKKPEQTAEEIGNFLQSKIKDIEKFEVVKGFLNLFIADNFWINFLNDIHKDENFGFTPIAENQAVTLIEYSSPNTNKPLHLGHIRNNLLGYSVSKILKANGKNVKMLNLVNDRGIHICKSMLAWQKFGNQETPETNNLKGDHLVGKYYVKFDKEFKAEVNELIAKGINKEIAEKTAPLLLEAQEMLRKWENEDKDVRLLWEKMNNWVYQGFEKTYQKLGVKFDKTYYESETYLLGKEIILEGLSKNILVQKEDKSIWADLTKQKLDEKILLRSDGTSVYMTQDIGTANLRFQDFDFEKLIYVVGNEQNYHFKVLSLVLKKLGFSFHQDLQHLSYGMVELPEGKMKSREGTVVDADDLIDEMIQTSKEISEELGKLRAYSKTEKEEIYKIIALGALKYFILKVDPKKNMTFNPKESIDFNGNTAPFIQYTYARIQSIFRNAKTQNIAIPTQLEEINLQEKEIQLLKTIYLFPDIVKEAGKNYSPALIANYIYDLVKDYNQFYHDFSVLKEENEKVRDFRLLLSQKIANIIKNSLNLLGINVPEKM